ncbi:Protein kinase domain [Dillenia turbinata]|uniref:non-specific serine/threonine protein kinase n=1 Tax=Dillenia turbinata TaxID=194707 RepID=A0AAN8WFE9_9MAGN
MGTATNLSANNNLYTPFASHFFVEAHPKAQIYLPKEGERSMMIKFIVLFSLLSLLSSSSASTTNTTSSASCPMDLSYVLRIQWNSSDCKNYENSSTSSSCCQTLLSLYGIALSEHLKETSNFNLPDIPTSISCLSSFQSYLNKLSLPSNLTSLCFDPLQFVITPNFCASIETKSDWINKLGTSTILDSACRPDLTDMTLCDACVGAAYKVQSQLVAMDGNSSHATNCFYLAVLYAAGIVNEFGPQSNGAITCMFSIPITSEVRSHSEPHLLLVFGLASAGVAVLVISCLLGVYFWWVSWKRKNGFDEEGQEFSPRQRLRPNTGSIRFKLEELEKATSKFSQKNFIGRGGFGIVYKGFLADGSLVAVKKILDPDIKGDVEFCNEVEIISNLKHRNLVPLRGCCMSDGNGVYDGGVTQRYLVYDYMCNGNLEDHLFFAGKIDEVLDASLLRGGDVSGSSYPRGIMERFVLVGILCAHVMVALRPTILDALKMLEGDIEVPNIPDRPASLLHPSVYSDTNTFSISPALSRPQLQAGEMLRCPLVPQDEIAWWNVKIENSQQLPGDFTDLTEHLCWGGRIDSLNWCLSM